MNLWYLWQSSGRPFRLDSSEGTKVFYFTMSVKFHPQSFRDLTWSQAEYITVVIGSDVKYPMEGMYNSVGATIVQLTPITQFSRVCESRIRCATNLVEAPPQSRIYDYILTLDGKAFEADLALCQAACCALLKGYHFRHSVSRFGKPRLPHAWLRSRAL